MIAAFWQISVEIYNTNLLGLEDWLPVGLFDDMIPCCSMSTIECAEKGQPILSQFNGYRCLTEK